MGDNEPDDELEKTLKTICVNECCILVYTVSLNIFIHTV